MTDKPTINHDPDEPQIDRSPGPWRALLPLLVMLWAWYLYFMPFDWYSLGLGFGTGVVLTAWVIDAKGNNLRQMRRAKSPRSPD